MIRKFILSFLTIVFILLGTSIPVLAQDETGEPFYVIQTGDSLSVIAYRFGVSIEDLILANNIDDPNAISVGTSLNIPGLEGVAGELIIQTVNLGENYLILTKQNRYPADMLPRLNRLLSPEEIYVGSRLILPKVETSEKLIPLFEIKEEESLFEVAIGMNSNPWEIMLSNGITNSSSIIAGDIVYGKDGESQITSPYSGLIGLEINPLPIAQGKTIEIRISVDEPMEIRGKMAGYELNFFPINEKEYVALQGIHAREETGITKIDLSGSKDGEEKFSIDQNLLVESGFFGQDPPITVEPITIQPDVIEPEQALVEEITAKITLITFGQ